MNLTPTILWAIIGISLMIAEIFTLSFVLIFFGVAALIVAGLVAMGLNNISIEIFIFAMIGLSGIFLFRKKMAASLKTKTKITSDVNQKLDLTDDIPAGKHARISYQGTLWTTHNESGNDLKKGDRVFITKTDGINLFVNTTPKPIEEK